MEKFGDYTLIKDGYSDGGIQGEFIKIFKIKDDLEITEFSTNYCSDGFGYEVINRLVPGITSEMSELHYSFCGEKNPDFSVDNNEREEILKEGDRIFREFTSKLNRLLGKDLEWDHTYYYLYMDERGNNQYGCACFAYDIEDDVMYQNCALSQNRWIL